MPQATFVLKEPKSQEPTLIYLFYNFNGQRLKYSTGQKVEPKYWNPEKQRVKETKAFKEYANFNFLLDKLETAVNDAYRKLILDDITPNTDRLKEALNQALVKDNSPKKDFVSFFEEVLEASDRKAGTKRAIRQTLNILKAFKAEKKIDLPFEAINLDFYNEFIDFLVQKDLRQSTIGTHIKNVKVFMREAFERGLTENAQFRSKRFKKLDEDSESIYLTKKELEKIYKLDLSEKPRLEKVRDLFIVACYTGLRYSDLMQLKIEAFNKEKKVIKVKTQKTDELVIIPINSTVNAIIEKYDGHLPLAISNQKMNDYLKEIAEEAKLEEQIERVSTKGGKRHREVLKKYELVTVHTARRSFASNAYMSNVPTISIMKITGHRTEKSFLKYIRISQEDNANKLISHPFFA